MTHSSALTDALLQGLYYVIFHLTRAVLTFLQRDSYLYWPFIASTLLIMLAVAWRGTGEPDGPLSRRQRLRSWFSARLWWHPSARADYRLYFANALIFPALIAPLILSDGAIADRMDTLLSRQPPGPAPSGLSEVILRIVFTAAFFVAYDFGRFAAHSLLHDMPALWPFHKVHHSAEVLTPMTSYRVHPVELLLMAWVPALATGVVTWAFNRFAGSGISAYSFLGLHVLIWLFNLIDNLRHSPVWLSYGPRLGRWLVSPAHHQLHHSVETRHWGCNRGSSLALWDRLYGTLYVPEAQSEPFRMGLGDGSEAQWHGLLRSYWQPFPESLRCLLESLPGRSKSAT